MKKMIFSMICMMVLCISASAQVKTFSNVLEDDLLVLNASTCKENQLHGYWLWVRYDYKNAKDCRKAAKADGIKGKAVRAEYLYEFDEPVLQYRILRKVYYDKNGRELGCINYNNASWNVIGDTDYSLKVAHYLAMNFPITVG